MVGNGFYGAITTSHRTLSQQVRKSWVVTEWQSRAPAAKSHFWTVRRVSGDGWTSSATSSRVRYFPARIQKGILSSFQAFLGCLDVNQETSKLPQEDWVGARHIGSPREERLKRHEMSWPGNIHSMYCPGHKNSRRLINFKCPIFKLLFKKIFPDFPSQLYRTF